MCTSSQLKNCRMLCNLYFLPYVNCNGITAGVKQVCIKQHFFPCPFQMLQYFSPVIIVLQRYKQMSVKCNTLQSNTLHLAVEVEEKVWKTERHFTVYLNNREFNHWTLFLYEQEERKLLRTMEGFSLSTAVSTNRCKLLWKSRFVMAKISKISIWGRNCKIFISLVFNFACLMLLKGISILPADRQLNWPSLAPYFNYCPPDIFVHEASWKEAGQLNLQ